MAGRRTRNTVLQSATTTIVVMVRTHACMHFSRSRQQYLILGRLIWCNTIRFFFFQFLILGLVHQIGEEIDLLNFRATLQRMRI